jgi:hypothetical protein
LPGKELTSLADKLVIDPHPTIKVLDGNRREVSGYCTFSRSWANEEMKRTQLPEDGAIEYRLFFGSKLNRPMVYDVWPIIIRHIERVKPLEPCGVVEKDVPGNSQSGLWI